MLIKNYKFWPGYCFCIASVRYQFYWSVFVKTIKAIGFIGALAFSAAASAVSVTWNTNQPGISEQAPGVSIFCGSTSTCQVGNATGLTGSIIKLTAWSTASLTNASATTSADDTGAWLAAKIAIFGGNGIGISNTVVSALQPRDGNGNEFSPSQHTMDNRGVDDILVIDFNPLGLANNSNWDVTSFSLGFLCAIDAAGTNCAGTSVNADAWGGAPTGTFGLANEAFSGGAGSTLPGFTALTLTNDPSSNTLRADASSPNPVGQFLVITPGLGGFSDGFKISSIVANTPTGNQAAPLPGTVPLLALGFLSFMLTHRRFSKITK